MGKGIILEATSLGLATCWVSGFIIKPEVAPQLAGSAEKEKVLAVTPIGYPKEEWSIEEKLMTGFGRNHQRKPLAELIIKVARSPISDMGEIGSGGGPSGPFSG